MRRYGFIGLFVLCVAVLLAAALPVGRDQAAQGAVRPYILLDAGHGGEDGGASGADGTPEKDINLAIALNMRALLQMLGCPVQMTRDADVSLSTEGDSVRARKVSDMYNRLERYDAAALVVSVHQNYFPQTQYFGTQIFYEPDRAESAALAESIRARVVRHLQPDNTRELKRADDNIFLLNETQTPAVLVECGFLSNQAERERLKQPEYQAQMALCVVAGLADHLSAP